jgi:hypothetical protein
MQIIYTNQYTETVKSILRNLLEPEQYTVQRIAYPDAVYSIIITGKISDSRLTYLKRALHDYTVDETRVRDWLGY